MAEPINNLLDDLEAAIRKNRQGISQLQVSGDPSPHLFVPLPEALLLVGAAALGLEVLKRRSRE